MKLHFGKPQIPGIIRFMSDGYRFKPHDGPEQLCPYSSPRAIDREIKKLYGVSWRKGFIGFMRTAEPNTGNKDG